jgi:hypothetical protein
MNISNIKILYIHHGVGGTVRSLEQLKKEGHISNSVSLEYKKKATQEDVLSFEKEVECLAKEHTPNLIIWYHICDFPIRQEFLDKIKNLLPSAKWAYQEIDAYGGFHKSLTKSMKLLINFSDFVLFSSGHPFSKTLRSHMQDRGDLLWLGPKALRDQWPDREKIIQLQDTTRKYDVVMIGSNTRSRIPLMNQIAFMQFPGSFKRWKTTKAVIKSFPGKVALFGSNWGDLHAIQESVPYLKQVETQQMGRVTAMWNHYDHLGLYSSDRTIIAMLSGVPHVTNYQPGYELLYGPNGTHLFWATNTAEYVDAIRYLLSLSPAQRTEIALRAFDFARAKYSTRDSWLELLKCLADRW